MGPLMTGWRARRDVTGARRDRGRPRARAGRGGALDRLYVTFGADDGSRIQNPAAPGRDHGWAVPNQARGCPWTRSGARAAAAATNTDRHHVLAERLSRRATKCRQQPDHRAAGDTGGSLVWQKKVNKLPRRAAALRETLSSPSTRVHTRSRT